MTKTVAIVQSNYIPWRGYFDLIASVDEFVLYDDAQFTKRDWRNRNKIKTVNGPMWLTVPVDTKGKFLQKIKDTRIIDPAWGQQHWKSLQTCYSKAGFFSEVRDLLEPIYRARKYDFLSELNRDLTLVILDYLKAETRVSSSMDYLLTREDPTEKLIELCRQTGATTYVSGPAAQDYLKEDLFQQHGIAVRYFAYPEYHPYRQLYPPFIPGMSVLDLLFNEGPLAGLLFKAGSPLHPKPNAPVQEKYDSH